MAYSGFSRVFLTLSSLSLAISLIHLSIGIDDSTTTYNSSAVEGPIVHANTDTFITIHNFPLQPSTHFHLYLTTTPPNRDETAACLLLDSEDRDATRPLTVNIPSLVGPVYHNYAILFVELELREERNGWLADDDRILEAGVSNRFKLLEAKGQWTQFELDGHQVGNAGYQSCEASACVRECCQKFYPENVEGGQEVLHHHDTYKCIEQCPGTKYRPWLPRSSEELCVRDDIPVSVITMTVSSIAATPRFDSSTATDVTTNPAVASSSSMISSSRSSYQFSSSTSSAGSPSRSSARGSYGRLPPLSETDTTRYILYGLVLAFAAL